MDCSGWLVGWLVVTHIVVVSWWDLSWLLCIYGPANYFLKDQIYFLPYYLQKGWLNVQMFVAVTWSRGLLYWVQLLLLLEWHHNGISWVEQGCILTGDISESNCYCLWMDYYYNVLRQYGEISCIYYFWARRDVSSCLLNATLTRWRSSQWSIFSLGFILSTWVSVALFGLARRN
jgi:hypothetical protein